MISSYGKTIYIEMEQIFPRKQGIRRNDTVGRTTYSSFNGNDSFYCRFDKKPGLIPWDKYSSIILINNPPLVHDSEWNREKIKELTSEQIELLEELEDVD